MPLRDFLLLLVVCLTWAVHTIVSKIAVTDLAIPPLFYAAVRYAVVAWLHCRGCCRCRARFGGSPPWGS
jgi:O-acetylserine/cysteine efflux transporter